MLVSELALDANPSCGIAAAAGDAHVYRVRGCRQERWLRAGGEPRPCSRQRPLRPLVRGAAPVASARSFAPRVCSGGLERKAQRTQNSVCMRRYNRLKYGMSGRSMQKINHAVVSIVSFLHIAPKGVKEVRHFFLIGPTAHHSSVPCLRMPSRQAAW
jgi:hypothetical protein